MHFTFNILYVIYTNVTYNIHIYYCGQGGIDHYNYCTVICHGETISMNNHIWTCSKTLLDKAIVNYNRWVDKWFEFYKFIKYKDIFTHMLSSYFVVLNN